MPRGWIELPQYITADEVRRVCKELGIRDWTALDEASATIEEAQAILGEVNTGKNAYRSQEFRAGLDVELEHGTYYKDANVTTTTPWLPV